MHSAASGELTLLLERLDLLLHREVLRLRASDCLSRDELRGLYVSDRQVDSLLVQRSGSTAAGSCAELSQRARALASAALNERGEESRWTQVAICFALSGFELDVVLLALALEVDPKYEVLFAYLNNDVSRKFPTCDLALRLFSSNAAERNAHRNFLQPGATLFRAGLLSPLPSSRERPSSLVHGFSLSPVVVRHLLEFRAPIGRVSPGVDRIRPTTSWESVPISRSLRAQYLRLASLVSLSSRDENLPIVVLQGIQGAPVSSSVEAFCAQCNLPLLRLNLAGFRASDATIETVAQALLLEQKLEGAAIMVTGLGEFSEGASLAGDTRALFEFLLNSSGPLFLWTERNPRWKELLQGRRVVSFLFEDPDYAERIDLWEKISAEAGHKLEEGACRDLASRFVLTAGQIRETLDSAQDAHFLRGLDNDHLSLEEIFSSARAQSDQSLSNLAAPVRTLHGWDDLVLPPVTLRQAREVASAIRNRHQVYSEWGFARRLAAGKGLKVLFSGPAGTGKTLTAGVIALDLGLSLYKIDLSGIVSKFIGETEKNLDRVFQAAECANAILFFDEADALFGKRSEVKDAHDRYANIEVAYLLQKMEDYDGPVILASNLSRNMDDAFARRMHYVIEFPLPNPAQRAALWQKMFPAEAPVSPGVDFEFLGEQFAIAGGDIRNVVLSAAFLAAQNGGVIQMKHVVQALARQLLKQGRVPDASEFKQYHSCLTSAD